ncbi:GMC family oxidoreductase N-terminal domain-containing protein [Mycobacteroides abscessus subsp. bolletii]|uniref:GMC family oxidoreductase n=1 Tax=Mycobacteroides abscessus TaxID=36809 RepID=UPI0019D10AF0|nr:GMC family oxidoreductase N-terminal domain-containing protein [Mycobacteroides abscessus]MBN7303146.1 GMC family oxidoreductase N-terminal domain-containing protein [Mycobacteroides abscessus subsp. bolletii]
MNQHSENVLGIAPRQRVALELIADTFAPGDGGEVPSATGLGSVELALRVLSRNPRSVELRALKWALSLWNSKLGGLLLSGHACRFSDLGPREREQFLFDLASSRFPQKRMLFTTLRNTSLVPYYIESDDTGRSPVWDALGYPGFPTPGVAAGNCLQPLNVGKDTTLDCDVVVVGSGAGGGTAAAVLAAAGLTVVVVEAGDYFHEGDFDGTDKTGLLNLYAGAPTLTAEGQLMLLAGRCVGGGTVINYTTCFRTPEHVRDEWASHGARQFAEDEYANALDAVWKRLGVNSDHDRAAARDAVMEQGLHSLGWSVGPTARNVLGCDMGQRCGRCGMGCTLGAKQSTAKTWLVDAAAAGARLVTGACVRTVEMRNGRACGVTAVAVGGHRLTVHARAVVVAAGAIQTPALLKRSGLTNRNIGRHLRLHPVVPVWGQVHDSTFPWQGSMQSRYSDHHGDLDGKGYGVIYETGPATPLLASLALPWLGGQKQLDSMRELRSMVPLAVIVRDSGAGEVAVGRDGEPIVRYTLSDHDTGHLMTGIEGAARILQAAGAYRVMAPHYRGIVFEPGKTGTVESFAAECRTAGAKPGTLTMASLHIMGSARMGDDPRYSATNPDGETWDTPGIVVADGSCFPTASGVNPMISIEAIAHMNATRLAARLT